MNNSVLVDSPGYLRLSALCMYSRAALTNRHSLFSVSGGAVYAIGIEWRGCEIGSKSRFGAARLLHGSDDRS